MESVPEKVPAEKASPSKKRSSKKVVAPFQPSPEQQAKLEELGLKPIWLNILQDYEVIQHLG